jgi:hypothetical protein
MTNPLLLTRRLALAATLSLALGGCAASAQFHSKNGQTLAPLTAQAVCCEENEIQAVMAAGGVTVGVIDAKALTTDATDDDVAAKAAKIAAKNGGTHLLRTEKGFESFTLTYPETYEKRCTAAAGTRDCQTTHTPPTTSTYIKPTAKFVVFAVPRQSWDQLPPALVPSRGADPFHHRTAPRASPIDPSDRRTQ